MLFEDEPGSDTEEEEALIGQERPEEEKKLGI